MNDFLNTKMGRKLKFFDFVSLNDILNRVKIAYLINDRNKSSF